MTSHLPNLTNISKRFRPCVTVVVVGMTFRSSGKKKKGGSAKSSEVVNRQACTLTLIAWSSPFLSIFLAERESVVYSMKQRHDTEPQRSQQAE